MYKASIEYFLEARFILSQLLSTEDTKVRYAVNKVLERINKNKDMISFIDEGMDKKVEYAKEKDGKIVRDENNEPEIKNEHRKQYRDWYNNAVKKEMEVEPYIISYEPFKSEIYLIEKLNGLLFSVKIEELL